MERDFEQDNSEFAEEDLTGYQSLRNTFLRLIREVNSDPAALVVLRAISRRRGEDYGCN